MRRSVLLLVLLLEAENANTMMPLLQPVKKTIPSWIFASFAALAVFVTSAALLYLRYHRQRAMREHIMGSRAHSGATKFTRLAQDDEEDIAGGKPAVMIELDSNNLRQAYGSL
jgi:hypothetical protein